MKRAALLLILTLGLGCVHHRPPAPRRTPDRIGAISDLHLGDPRSLLDDEDGRSMLVHAISEAVEKDGVHTLVLDGDALELSLASEARAWSVARALVAELALIDGLDRLVFVVGNHDHRLFEELPGDPRENLGHVFDEGTAAQRELEGVAGDLRISVVYPDWTVSLPQGNVHFTHGHYFDRSTTPSFEGAQSFADLERRNSAWLSFITAGGQDPLTRSLYRSLYHFGQHFTGVVDTLEGRNPDPVVIETSERTVARVSYYVTGILKDDRAIAIVAGHTHHAGGLATTVRAGDRDILFFDTGALVASHTGLATHPQIFELDLDTADMRLIPIEVPPALMQRAEDRAFSQAP